MRELGDDDRYRAASATRISLPGVGDSRPRPDGLLLRSPDTPRKHQPDLFEVATDRIRDPVGIRLEHAIGNTAVIGRVCEVPVPPAEDLRGPALSVAEDQAKGPEAGDPVIRIVQAQLG